MKLSYEKPIAIPLGEALKGSGECNAGSAVMPGSTECNTGDGAGPFGGCILGDHAGIPIA